MKLFLFVLLAAASIAAILAYGSTVPSRRVATERSAPIPAGVIRSPAAASTSRTPRKELPRTSLDLPPRSTTDPAPLDAHGLTTLDRPMGPNRPNGRNGSGGKRQAGSVWSEEAESGENGVLNSLKAVLKTFWGDPNRQENR